MTEMLAKNNEVKNKVKKQKKSQFKEICMRFSKNKLAFKKVKYVT